MELYIIIAIVAYWTFSVVAIAFAFVTVQGPNWRLYGAGFLWPVITLTLLLTLPYTLLVHSTKRIRTDLRNRKLLKEFEVWNAIRKGNFEWYGTPETAAKLFNEWVEKR